MRSRVSECVHVNESFLTVANSALVLIVLRFLIGAEIVSYSRRIIINLKFLSLYHFVKLLT